jgi:hypothetical protein
MAGDEPNKSESDLLSSRCSLRHVVERSREVEVVMGDC